MKTEILYGVHSVQEALAAGRRRIAEVCVEKGAAPARLRGIRQAAGSSGIPVRELSAAQLASLAGTPAHQGVAARASAYLCHDLPRGRNAPGHRPAGPWLALDQIMDPHNLGAMLRAALCAGVEAVLIPKDRSAPPSPAVSKISAGALEHIRLVQVTNLVRGLDLLKSHGLWVVGLERGGTRGIFETDLTMPLVLVIGGEGRGMRPLVRQTCDLLVSIPQAGPLDSLNASVAAGVALFEIRRQQTIQRPPAAGDGTDGQRDRG